MDKRWQEWLEKWKSLLNLSADKESADTNTMHHELVKKSLSR